MAARKGLRSALVVLLALVLSVLVATRVDLTATAVDDLVTRARPGVVLLAFAMMSSGLVFLSLRWRALMPDRRRVRLFPLTAIYSIGMLLNYALPGPVGELVAATMAGRRFGMSAEMAFAASVHARFIGLSVAGIVAGVLYCATDLPVGPDIGRWIGFATAAITCGAVFLGVLSARPATLRRVAEGMVGRVRRLAPLHASALRFAGALEAMGRLGPGAWIAGVGWALLGHACVVSGIVCVATGLGADPNPAGVAFTYAMSTAGAVVLFAFPGSQLGWDAMFATLLVTTAGLTLPDSLAVTVLVRAQQILVVLAGALALLRHVTAHGDDGVPPVH